MYLNKGFLLLSGLCSACCLLVFGLLEDDFHMNSLTTWANISDTLECRCRDIGSSSYFKMNNDKQPSADIQAQV